MIKDGLSFAKPEGFIRIFSQDKRGNIIQAVETPNLIVYSGADIVARCLAWQQLYFPRVVYFEFENTAGVPTPPTPTRADDDLSYYTALASPKDYIRVPIGINPSLDTTDVSKYASNRVTYYAMTDATEGEHSVPFSAGSNSKVYGAALIAAPDLNDPTQDVIMSRVYFTAVAKGDSQIGIQWQIVCK